MSLEGSPGTCLQGQAGIAVGPHWVGLLPVNDEQGLGAVRLGRLDFGGARRNAALLATRSRPGSTVPK